MKLNEKLLHIQKQMATQLPPDILQIFGQSLQEIMQQQKERNALKVGDIAPNFTLLDSNNLPVSLYERLEQYRLEQDRLDDNRLNQQSIIVSFFRGNWCPFCMEELSHYQEAISNHKIERARVIAISPQTTQFNRAISEQKQLTFSLLSDQGNTIAAKFGLVFTLPEHMREIYKNIGADLTLFNHDNQYQLPIPATYIIDKNRKITFANVNSNYMERADICDMGDKL